MNYHKTKPRQRWLRPVTIVIPTLRTWVVIALVFLVVSISFARGIRGYLAPLEPQKGAKTLVIESWADEELLHFIEPLIRSGRYSRYIPVGSPIDPLSPFGTFGTGADLWAARLAKAGVPREKIEVVRVPKMSRHRTAHSALAVARHLSTNPAQAVDLLTQGAHGRRSHKSYLAALSSTRVGILSAPTPHFAESWWRSSGGVRSVIGELLALGYFVFAGDEIAAANREWQELPPQERKVSGSWER